MQLKPLTDTARHLQRYASVYADMFSGVILLLIYNIQLCFCLLYHAIGTISGTASGTTQHSSQYGIPYSVVLYIISHSPADTLVQSCISHSIVLLLLLLLYISYYCTPIIYNIVYLYSYHIHINSLCLLYLSFQTYVLFTLHITLLIFLQSHSHATSQPLLINITQLLSVMSIASVICSLDTSVYLMALFSRHNKIIN